VVGTEAVYSRSWTACEEDLAGGVVSEVEERTEPGFCEMALWSSVQKP